MSPKAAAAGRDFLPAPRPTSAWITVVLVLLVLTLLLPPGLYLYYGVAQRGLTFTVDDGGLSARFGVGRIDIPLSDIQAVTLADDPPRMGRVRGAGMPGFQMGWYNMQGYGRVYRLTTTARPVVYVDTRSDAARARPDTRYVFSPEEPERFVALLEALRSGETVGTTPAEFRSAAAPSIFTDPLMLVLLVVTLPLGALGVYILFKGPRTMLYSVGPDGIVVRHLGRRLYRWNSVRDVRRIDEPLSRVWRVMGAAMPGYYAGDFSAKPLGSVKMYATRLQPPLVLLETRIGKVVLSPDDVQGFLAAVDEYRPPTNDRE